MNAYWVTWVVAVLGTFFAYEIPAIRNARKGDTLSEQLRLWFHTDTKTGRWVFIVGFGVFAMWFGPHIVH